MRKIAFFGIFGHTRYTYSGEINQCDAMPRSSGTGLDNILELYKMTDNKGNMIHGEAPTRIFKSDRSRSCYVSVQALEESGWSPERISEELSARFDLVVFSTANIIRPNLEHGATARILDGLRVDFIVLGVSMQKLLPQNTSMLHPSIIDFLNVCNKKARIFGVRGLETEKWLKSVGFERAKAIGCPSMYVYPDNVLNVSAPDPAKAASAVTGGYIHGRVPRSTALIGLFRGFDVHYIMQEEMAIWKERGLIDSSHGLYNDATGEVRKEIVNKILEEIHYEPMPFSSYRWFQDPNAWRMFSSRSDFYLGDRLHGGIVALQVGIPAILIAEDIRVAESADFFKIPRISVKDMERMSLREILADRLTVSRVEEFKETYFSRFREFESTLKDAGIQLTARTDKIGQPAVYKYTAPRRKVKPGLIRFIRRWLRKI